MRYLFSSHLSSSFLRVWMYSDTLTFLNICDAVIRADFSAMSLSPNLTTLYFFADFLAKRWILTKPKPTNDELFRLFRQRKRIVWRGWGRSQIPQHRTVFRYGKWLSSKFCDVVSPTSKPGLLRSIRPGFWTGNEGNFYRYAEAKRVYPYCCELISVLKRHLDPIFRTIKEYQNFTQNADHHFVDAEGRLLEGYILEDARAVWDCLGNLNKIRMPIHYLLKIYGPELWNEYIGKRYSLPNTACYKHPVIASSSDSFSTLMGFLFYNLARKKTPARKANWRLKTTTKWGINRLYHWGRLCLRPYRKHYQYCVRLSWIPL